ICYANKAFETLTGQDTNDCAGKGWSILAAFKAESDLQETLEMAMLEGGEEFLGMFRREQPQPLVVEAFSGLIENEDGTENYRIAALIDITNRVRTEREEYAGGRGGVSWYVPARATTASCRRGFLRFD